MDKFVHLYFLALASKHFYLAQAADLNPAQIFHSFLSLKPYKVGTGPFSSGFSFARLILGKILMFFLENGCLIINFRPKKRQILNPEVLLLQNYLLQVCKTFK